MIDWLDMDFGIDETNKGLYCRLAHIKTMWACPKCRSLTTVNTEQDFVSKTDISLFKYPVECGCGSEHFDKVSEPQLIFTTWKYVESTDDGKEAEKYWKKWRHKHGL